MLLKRKILILVYTVYFLDNVLMTIIVPILPDYYYEQYKKEAALLTAKNSTEVAEFHQQDTVGYMFGSKALVQLFANFLVGPLSKRFGYKGPMLFGTLLFSCSSLRKKCLRSVKTCLMSFFAFAQVFAIGDSNVFFVLARSLHGLASALSIVASLALLAVTYSDDAERSKAVGLAMSGMALGVLVGYPLGGFTYQFLGKSVPFIFTMFVGIAATVAQRLLLTEDCSVPQAAEAIPARTMLKDRQILSCLGAIGFSTTAIAVLEPMLPLWLETTIKPEKWQIGTAFIPDSFGYLIGTNVFGIYAMEMLLRILACDRHLLATGTIPLSSHMYQLILPHFGVGLGVATIDASLVPLLACLVDMRHRGSYGTVFALSQSAVCLAYFLGPFIGGWLFTKIGFPWVLRLLAVINAMYSVVVFCALRRAEENEEKRALLTNEESSVCADSHYLAIDDSSILAKSDSKERGLLSD